MLTLGNYYRCQCNIYSIYIQVDISSSIVAQQVSGIFIVALPDERFRLIELGNGAVCTCYIVFTVCHALNNNPRCEQTGTEKVKLY